MNKQKICMISSSGGHYEQLQMLKKLEEFYDLFWVTEQVNYGNTANYYLKATGSNNKFVIFQLIYNCVISLKIWLKEKPDAVITTGTLVAIPICMIAKLFHKKVIYIETFAHIYDCTRAGKFMYKFADLFIYQWESLSKYYPNGVYGGSIY